MNALIETIFELRQCAIRHIGETQPIAKITVSKNLYWYLQNEYYRGRSITESPSLFLDKRDEKLYCCGILIEQEGF